MLTLERRRQSGAASMIVVIFMAIILSIVTIGFIRIAINEQRTSTDDDLTARAYYAAESGLEDAKRAIKRHIEDSTFQLNGDTCAPPAGYSSTLSGTSEFDVEYTCQLIDFTPSIVTSEFSSANQVKQINVKPVNSTGVATTFDSLTLRWHLDAVAPAGDGAVSGGGPVYLRGASDYSLPQNSAWPNPAMMKLTFISYPDGSPANRITETSIIASTVLLSPNAASATNGQSGVVFPGGNTVNATVDGQVLGADCVDSNDNMVCEMTFDFTGFPANRNLDIRLSNLYASTTTELTMLNGATPVFFEDAQVVVDVTGRAGGVYRRIEASLDLNSPNLLPEFAVQSGTDICKDFSFTNSTTSFGGGAAGSSCTRE